VVFLLMAGGAGWLLVEKLIPWYREQLGDGTKSAAAAVDSFPLMNFQFTYPAKPWTKDDKAKIFGVASLVGVRRTEPNGWLTLGAMDYKTRTPRDAEVMDDLIRRLAETFAGFEWTLQKDGELGAQRAQRLAFQGDLNHVRMLGDCHVLTYKGIVYWMTVWGPAESAESSREEFGELTKCFALLKERGGWTEKRPPVVTFAGEKVPYSLRDKEGIWEKIDQAKEVDVAADLLIQGKDSLESRDRMGRVVVLVLDKQPDLATAVKQARAHLEEQQRHLYPATKTDVVLGPEGAEDRAGSIGEVPGHIVKLHVKNTANRERFVLLAVVQLPEHVLAIQCECDWKRRSLWEADFKQLLGTFSLKVP
jgi:hypothetical protein